LEVRIIERWRHTIKHYQIWIKAAPHRKEIETLEKKENKVQNKNKLSTTSLGCLAAALSLTSSAKYNHLSLNLYVWLFDIGPEY